MRRLYIFDSQLCSVALINSWDETTKLETIIYDDAATCTILTCFNLSKVDSHNEELYAGCLPLSNFNFLNDPPHLSRSLCRWQKPRLLLTRAISCHRAAIFFSWWVAGISSSALENMISTFHLIYEFSYLCSVNLCSPIHTTFLFVCSEMKSRSEYLQELSFRSISLCDYAMTWGWTSVTPADVLNILWNALESSISLQLAGTYSVLCWWGHFFMQVQEQRNFHAWWIWNRFTR